MWNDVLKEHWTRAITSRLDDHQIRSLLHQRHYVSLTKLPSLQNVLVSEFCSIEDMVRGARHLHGTSMASRETHHQPRGRNSRSRPCARRTAHGARRTAYGPWHMRMAHSRHRTATGHRSTHASLPATSPFTIDMAGLETNGVMGSTCASAHSTRWPHHLALSQSPYAKSDMPLLSRSSSRSTTSPPPTLNLATPSLSPSLSLPLPLPLSLPP